MLRLALLMIALALPAAADPSAAAAWLRDEQIAEGCPDGGAIASEGLIEIDLNMDGRDDLVLDHNAMTCRGDWSRSQFCGVQACSILLYIRSADGLLMPADELLGVNLVVTPGDPPVLSGLAHGGDAWRLRWSGTGFELF